MNASVNQVLTAKRLRDPKTYKFFEPYPQENQRWKPFICTPSRQAANHHHRPPLVLTTLQL